MNENITILHSNLFDFEDPKTQRRISGIKIQYIFNDDLEPIHIDTKEKGYQIADAVLPLESEYQISKVPGVYKAKFLTRVNAKGQPIQKLVGIEYVSTIPELFVKPVAQKAV